MLENNNNVMKNDTTNQSTSTPNTAAGVVTPTPADVVRPGETEVTTIKPGKPAETKVLDKAPEDPAKPVYPNVVKPVNGAKPDDKNDAVVGPDKDLIRNVPMLKSRKIFGPYLMAFLYYALLLAFIGGLFFLPIINRDTSFDGVMELGEFKLDGLVSVFSVIQEDVIPAFSASVTDMIDIISPYFILALITLFIAIQAIVIFIRWIRALFGMIFAGARKRKVIDRFYFKNTHQFYKLGALEKDFSIFFAILLEGGFLAIINVPQIRGFLNLPAKMLNYQLLNFGNVILAGGLVLLILFKIIFRISVGVLNRRVKKNYIAKKKKKK